MKRYAVINPKNGKAIKFVRVLKISRPGFDGWPESSGQIATTDSLIFARFKSGKEGNTKTIPTKYLIELDSEVTTWEAMKGLWVPSGI